MFTGLALCDGKETKVEFLHSVTASMKSSKAMLEIALNAVSCFLNGDYGSASDIESIAELNVLILDMPKVGVYVIEYPYRFAVVVAGVAGDELTVFDENDVHSFVAYLEEQKREKSKYN
jgi:hypothetical protein